MILPQVQKRKLKHDLTGLSFGLWRVGTESHRAKGHVYWDCVCKCGKRGVVASQDLRRRTSLGCGCERNAATGIRFTTHGLSRSAEYQIWSGMLERCLRQTSAAYSNYGERGIGICDRWLVFENFYADMGPRPTGRYTLERKDNNKGYSPENCIWATYHVQARNRRNTTLVTFRNETKCMTDWSAENGIGLSTISQRVRELGWCGPCAVSLPVGEACSHR